MARIPYPEEKEELAELIRRIRAERGGRLANLYKMLLHSPSVAEGWLQLLTAIRQKCTLDGKARELAIIRVGLLNGAEYESKGHVPFALKEGIRREQIEALADWRRSKLFDEGERAVLAYTDAMTREVRVPEEVFGALRPYFNDRELMELTATIAAYNLVSRFLMALEVDAEKAPPQA